MNPDYVIKGKSQLTVSGPDWATARGSVASAGDAAETASSATRSAAARGGKKSVGPDVENVDFTFNDFIDAINPLQHIPVVNMIYRNMTGDKISGVAQVAGSALYGGPIGIVAGVIDAIFEQEKGGSAGEVVMASLMGKDLKPSIPAPGKKVDDAPIMVASAEKTPAASPAPVAETPDGEEENAPVAVAQKTLPPVPEKAPFGGMLANNAPGSEEAEEAPAATPARQMPITAPSAAPVPHKPVEVDGRKFYSLAGVVRHGGAAAMPVPDSPDVRLKSLNMRSSNVAAKNVTKDAIAAATADNASADSSAKEQANAEALLGIAGKTTPLATARYLSAEPSAPAFDKAGATGPGFSNLAPASPSGNPLPPQLIQDMMMMNLQKYQDGVKSGTLRGNTLDVEG